MRIFVCISRCGDNGAKWLIEIAKRKKVRVTLSSLMTLRQDVPIYVLNDNSVINTYDEYLSKYKHYLHFRRLPAGAIDWCKANAPEAYKDFSDEDLWEAMAYTYYTMGGYSAKK